MEGKDITTGHDEIEEVICFYSLGKVISPFRYFVISSFRVLNTPVLMKHNQNMIAAIYHQLGVWINYFYGHSWLFRQSLKYISMLRVTWTEHKTNEEVLKMANTTRSLLPMIKKRKCQYFERGRSGQTSGPVASVKDLGITLDSYLNFNDNVYTFTSSLLSMLCQISRVRHLFTKPVLSTTLNSLIFSKLFYCSTVWAGTSK